MIYNGTPLVPLRSTYNPELMRSVIQTSLGGGPSRIVRNEVRKPVKVSVEYFLKSTDMVEWFRLWYRRDTKEGGLQFTARLAFNGVLNPYICQWVSAPALQYTGWRGVVRGELEVLGFDVDSVTVGSDDDIVFTEVATEPDLINNAGMITGPAGVPGLMAIEEFSFSFISATPPSEITDPVPRMEYNGELVLPERTSIVETLPWGAVRVEGRNRPDTLNNPSYFTATYRLTGGMISWFEVWYRNVIREGSMPFVTDMGYGESVAQLMNAPVYQRNTGFISDVAMQLEVENPLIPSEQVSDIMVVG